MRRGSISALLCALVLLAGCQSQPPALAKTETPPPPPSPGQTAAPTPEPTPEAEVDGSSVYARYPTTKVPMSRVDFASYEDELDEEDWQALSAFFPVLIEGKTVMAAHTPEFGAEPATLEEQSLNDLFAGLDEPPEEFCLSSFTLCDITGDGQKELAIYTDDFAGWNYVFHREDDTVYGVYMPIRWFEGLQENGVFWGSGGAATSDYERLHFGDGTAWVELLGNTDWGYYAIDGEEVSQERFKTWLEGLLVGEVPWHVARAIQT